MNNDDFTVLVSGGSRHHWVSVVCCVAVAFKMTEGAEQWICTKFCDKLEHYSMETTWMIQKSTAMGNWWLAASSQQCTCSRIRSHAEFYGEPSDDLGDSCNVISNYCLSLSFFLEICQVYTTSSTLSLIPRDREMPKCNKHKGQIFRKTKGKAHQKFQNFTCVP